MQTETPADLFTCVSLLARDPTISDEESERIIQLADALGTRRAELLGQPYAPSDLVYALSLLCRWPFKPEPYIDYRNFLDATLPMIIELEASPIEIAAQFPPEALELDFGELFSELENGTLLQPVEAGFNSALEFQGP